MKTENEQGTNNTGTVTFQAEPIDKAIDDATALISEHWVECACWKDKVKLNPDKDRFIAAEALGIAKAYTMRDDEGRLIGYAGVLVNAHLHYKEDVFAMVDVLYLDPHYRAGLSAYKFMRWVEARVKELGASVMTYHIKSFHDYPAIFERLGFEKIEYIYAKCLKE